ncbi:DUF2007 domain-containing protein [Pseudohongiella spirulinae]|uniref:putative signal transducing protein n=1 Tax=Pseudohongiella spirulinae TaxID=1249552 RepID=UPI0009EAFB7F|nr:DUF2007 domain-containing protein [Pseudohongiella spirulinae]
MKIIYHAADIVEAHIVAGLLQSHGIDAHVGGHYLQGGAGGLPLQGLATVQVHDDDCQAAQSVIDDYEQSAAQQAGQEDSDEHQADRTDPDTGISYT